MREQGGSYAIASASLGGRALGSGTALVDEDVLRVLLLDSPTAEKSIQIHYASIVGVAIREASVVVTCRDGRGLVVSTDDGSAFRGRVLAACRALPEVTRALRALGSRRGARGVRRNPGNGEARFFAPLIAARRAAMDARDAASVVAAFEANLLARALAATIVNFAEERGGGHPARRRAAEAELSDACDQLSACLTALAELAARAVEDVDDLERWREWAAGVQATFEAADRSWVIVEQVVSR